MSYSKTQLLGNLGADPRLTHFENGGVRIEFSLATQDGYRDTNGVWQTITDWHLCFCTGKRAETLGKYLKKGSQIFIEGKNKTRKYKGNDGVERYVTEVKILEFSFTGRAEPQQNENTGVVETGTTTAGTSEEDDFPF